MLRSQFPSRFCVTGTDTDVGKSVISGMLMLSLDTEYWKPIQSGQPADTQWLAQVTGLSKERFHPEHYRLTQPLSPHLAAHLDGKRIEIEQMRLPTAQRLIVEGAGGLLVPLNSGQLICDLFQHFQLPLVIVSRSTLGTINHTLLTLEAARKRGLEVLGVILNGPSNPENRKAIETYGGVEVLGEVPPLDTINPQTLAEAFASA